MNQPASAALIRQWARDAGIAVGDRGRLTPEVISAYDAAHTSVRGAEPTARRPTSAPAARGSFRIAADPRRGAGVRGQRIRARAR